MKNKGFYAGITFIAFVCALTGCESKEFRAERKMWKAHRLAQEVYKNPKATPPMQLQKAQDAYREMIEKYPNSLFAIQAQFSIGHLYLVMNEYENARNEYKKLINDCEKKGNLCAEGVFAIGNAYEAEGKWDQALETYRKIMEAYPFSTKSLDLPIYVIRHYKKEKDDKGIVRSTDEAVSYYTGLKARTEAPKGAFILQSLITRSYLESGMWQDAMDQLDKLVRDYPDQDPTQSLWIKALIYHNKLKDKEKAREMLERIVNDYPQSRLAKTSQELLKKF